MAKKKEESIKIVLEREYNVPLRKEWLKVPKYKRAKKAVTALKQFLKRHMKAEDIKNVKVLRYANLDIWKRGIKNPPHHIKVIAKKDEKGIVTAELVGAPVEKKEGEKTDKKKVDKKETKKEDKKPAAKKKEEKAEKPEEKPKAEKKSEEKTEKKPEPKEEKPAEKPVKKVEPKTEKKAE